MIRGLNDLGLLDFFAQYRFGVTKITWQKSLGKNHLAKITWQKSLHHFDFRNQENMLADLNKKAAPQYTSCSMKCRT